MLEIILLNILACIHQKIQPYCNPYIFSLKSSVLSSDTVGCYLDKGYLDINVFWSL